MKIILLEDIYSRSKNAKKLYGERGKTYKAVYGSNNDTLIVDGKVEKFPISTKEENIKYKIVEH